MLVFEMLRNVVYGLFFFVLFYAVGFAACMHSKNSELELKYTLIFLGVALILCIVFVFFNAFLESRNKQIK